MPTIDKIVKNVLCQGKNGLPGILFVSAILALGKKANRSGLLDSWQQPRVNVTASIRNKISRFILAGDMEHIDI